jgi:hypothetical protein
MKNGLRKCQAVGAWGKWPDGECGSEAVVIEVNLPHSLCHTDPNTLSITDTLDQQTFRPASQWWNSCMSAVRASIGRFSSWAACRERSSQVEWTNHRRVRERERLREEKVLLGWFGVGPAPSPPTSLGLVWIVQLNFNRYWLWGWLYGVWILIMN